MIEYRWFIADGFPPVEVAEHSYDGKVVAVCNEPPDGAKEVTEKEFRRAVAEWEKHRMDEWEKGLQTANEARAKATAALEKAFTKQQLDALRAIGVVA